MDSSSNIAARKKRGDEPKKKHRLRRALSSESVKKETMLMMKKLQRKVECINLLKQKLMRGKISVKMLSKLLFQMEIDGAQSTSAAATAKSQTVLNAAPLNPYNPGEGREVEDVGILVSAKKPVYACIRFSPDWIIAIERIPLDFGTYNVAYYEGWSLRRCKVGQDPYGEVIDSKGQSRKPFNFSGKLSTLPEMHLALRRIEWESQPPSSVTNSNEALQLAKDRFNVCDITPLYEPKYTKKVL